MRRAISIVSASAGSGKTTEIVRQLTERLDAGTGVAPESVVATTFTVRAGRELENRVAAKLYEQGHFDFAARMSDARIGTVHSIAGELLKEYAYDLGISPHLEVIPEEDQQALFAESLGRVVTEDETERMTALWTRLALTAGSSESNDWRHQVRRVAEAARTNGIDAASLRRQGDRAADDLRAYFDPLARSGDTLQAEVNHQIERVLAGAPAAGDTTEKTRQALERVRLARNAFMSQTSPAWTHWIGLSKLDPGAKTREIVEPLARAASDYIRHPQLAEDLRELIGLVFELAGRLTAAYQEFKDERGLIDYADQEQRLLGALRQESIAASVAERFRLLLVDEFQDTNPVQLSIFLKLADLVDEVIWVGDPKQSIYGFRDADPALMEAALDAIGQPGDILGTSYRSRPDIVRFTNALFTRAFDAAGARGSVTVQAHRSDESREMGAAVHVWKLVPTERNTKDAQAQGTARAITRLLEDGTVILDPANRTPRTAQPGDIAVLARSGADAHRVVSALHRAGLKSAAERNGLKDTIEATLLRAALRYLADPQDTLALAELRLLVSDTPDVEATLAARLEAMAEDSEWPDSPHEIERLDALRDRAAKISIGELVDAIVAQMDLHRLTLRFDGASARRANIEKLRELASAYEDWCRRFSRSPNTAGFVLWLDREPSSVTDRQGAGRGPDAVNVLTYHGAKGLEWPVVVAHGLDREPRVSSFGLSVVQDAPFDAARPLAGRRIRYWPAPGGEQSKNELNARVADSQELAAEREAQRTEEIRLLYVGLTRARDYLILAIPQSGGRKNPVFRLAWLDAALAEEFPIPERDGLTEVEVNAQSVSVQVETVELPGKTETAAPSERGELTWFTPSEGPRYYPPYHVIPSDTGSNEGGTLTITERIDYAKPVSPPFDTDPRALGDAMHALYCRYIRSGELSERDVERITRAYEVDTGLEPADVLARIREPIRILGDRHRPESVLAEVPVRHAQDGQLMSGVIDALLLSETERVIVDHKVSQVTREDLETHARRYARQLRMYTAAVDAGFGAGGTRQYLNFPVQGTVLFVETQDL